MAALSEHRAHHFTPVPGVCVCVCVNAIRVHPPSGADVQKREASEHCEQDVLSCSGEAGLEAGFHTDPL